MPHIKYTIHNSLLINLVFLIFLGGSIDYLQLSLVPLDDLGEGAAPRLQASITVQTPQLAIPTRPVGDIEL